MLSNLEANYIAIQIIYFLDKYEYSPNSYFSHSVLVKMLDGKEVSVASLYRRLKNNINYVDDKLIEKINSYGCIFKKLSKNQTN